MLEQVEVALCNVGARDSDEVAQVYTATPEGPLPAPMVRLAEYTRTHLATGACTQLSWTLPPVAWAAATGSGELFTQAGRIPVSVGGGQPGYTTGALTVDAFFGPPLALPSCGDALEMQKVYYGGSTGSGGASASGAATARAV